MEVLILAKTKMSHSVCVGGILEDGRYVRLMDGRGFNQAEDTEFEVGEIYTIEFRKHTNLKPPHIEDIMISDAEFLYTIYNQEIIDRLEKHNVKIWRGEPEELFDGCLKWTDAGSGYVAPNHKMPEHSVGFWISDKDLTRHEHKNRIRYDHPPIRKSFGGFAGPREWRNFPFVGLQDAEATIAAGTIIRVSLSRWWKPDDGDDEERCYLQISGWYGID